MDEVTAAQITHARGVGTDTRGKPGRRQVTVLGDRAWRDACAVIGTQLPWTVRRANLFVEGLDLRARVGYELHVGEAVLRITGETRPCHRMDEAHAGLREALEPLWRGGVTCTVVQSGHIAVGDRVILQRLLPQQLAFATHARARTLYRRGRAIAGATRAWLRDLRGA
jgi:MOSC domain-containing protein YiiM